MPPTTNSTSQRGTLPPCSSAKWEAEGGPCPPASSFARSPPTHGLSHASARLLRSPPDLARPRPLNQAVASTDHPLPWRPCRLKLSAHHHKSTRIQLIQLCPASQRTSPDSPLSGLGAHFIGAGTLRTKASFSLEAQARPDDQRPPPGPVFIEAPGPVFEHGPGEGLCHGTPPPLANGRASYGRSYGCEGPSLVSLEESRTRTKRAHPHTVTLTHAR